MPSPFPGMDPYLESPELWPDVHHEFIAEMQGRINNSIRPNYVARVRLRVYVATEGDPGRRAIIPETHIGRLKDLAMLIDEEIKESRLEIMDVKSKSLVTVIELMSPTNKIAGAEGRKSFLKKRREILGSEVNWVEIDLLRAGLPSQPPRVPSDYRILISKGPENLDGRFWPVYLRQALPMVGIPLRHPDPAVPLDLGAVLRTAYDRAAYDLSVDYAVPPDPPLGADEKWADDLLREKGLR